MALLVLSLDFSIDFCAILARKQNAENAVDGDDISTIEKIPSLERTFADSRKNIPESIGTINQ